MKQCIKNRYGLSLDDFLWGYVEDQCGPLLFDDTCSEVTLEVDKEALDR